MSNLVQPLKWHGGKSYLAKRIVSLMPPHIHYCEPFAGGLAVLLERDPDDERLWLPPHKGVSEVVNDINGRLTNFWRVLQNPAWFEKFYRAIQFMPLSRPEWVLAHKNLEPGCVEDAANFFIDCRQSLAGRMQGFTAITRTRTRRQMNGGASEWIGAVDGLLDVHERLRRVVIENVDAVDLIKREDTPGTLFYCDPPYVSETRTAKNVYAYEMDPKDHHVLLCVLLDCKGNVMLSGYRCAMYDDALRSWNRVDWDIANNSAGGKTKRRMIESLWMNF